MASTDAPRRPRLSLQIKPSTGPITRSSRMAPKRDPKSPTSFNTLSNVYVTAIERSTPVQSTPVTAIKQRQPLKLRTDSASLTGQEKRTQTPLISVYPDTPVSAGTTSPAQQMDIIFPSQRMTATPPLSAGAMDSAGPQPFTFEPNDTKTPVTEEPVSPAMARRRIIYASMGSASKAPYSHNRSLHSILRNSPLPPPSATSPISPRRQSRRLQEKAARRVGYESPLEQTITTHMYTRSHVDLLSEDASPYTPSPAVEDSDKILDHTMAYTGNETRDGGHTPGPFEEMRRRMAGSGAETPVLSPRPEGVKKRKKRADKKLQWVWTIGTQDDDEDDDSGALAGLRAAIASESTPRATMPRIAGKANTPEPVTAVKISVEAVDSESDSNAGFDVEMSDTSSMLSSRATTPYSMDLDDKTPTVSAPARMSSSPAKRARIGSVDMIDPQTGTRRDTPIPEDLVTAH